MKLTKATLDRIGLPDGKGDKIVFDESLPGFGLRLRAGGKRTWIVQYRIGAQQRRLSLGSVEALDPAEARKRAKNALAIVQGRGDPQAEKVASRVPKAAATTLGIVIDRYLDNYAKAELKPGTYSGVVLHLKKHWAPLHDHELRNLERRHVAAELNRIKASSGPYGANRSRSALSALFGWAIAEGLADTNPVVGTRKAIEEVARERVLTHEELTTVWRHAGDGEYGSIVRLLILTGQRREEVAGIAWSEINFRNALWSIPGDRTKNSRPHDVPLSLSAIEILSSIARRGERALIFGQGDGPFQGWTNAKKALDARMKDAGFSAPWRLHDLRRTAATRMADLGVQPHIIEAVLNHISGHKAGVAGIYNRSVYAPEKRAALDLWAQFVTSLEGVKCPA